MIELWREICENWPSIVIGLAVVFTGVLLGHLS